MIDTLGHTAGNSIPDQNRIRNGEPWLWVLIQAAQACSQSIWTNCSTLATGQGPGQVLVQNWKQKVWLVSCTTRLNIFLRQDNKEILLSNMLHVYHPLTFQVTGGLTLFHQTGMVRALYVFCRVVVAGGFGTRKLGVGNNSSGFHSWPFWNCQFKCFILDFRVC